MTLAHGRATQQGPSPESPAWFSIDCPRRFAGTGSSFLWARIPGATPDRWWRGRWRVAAGEVGYCTWVEQQGTRLGDFDARRDQGFRDGLMDLVPVWDARTEDLNAAVS